MGLLSSGTLVQTWPHRGARYESRPIGAMTKRQIKKYFCCFFRNQFSSMRLMSPGLRPRQDQSRHGPVTESFLFPAPISPMRRLDCTHVRRLRPTDELGARHDQNPIQETPKTRNLRAAVCLGLYGRRSRPGILKDKFPSRTSSVSIEFRIIDGDHPSTWLAKESASTASMHQKWLKAVKMGRASGTPVAKQRQNT